MTLAEKQNPTPAPQEPPQQESFLSRMLSGFFEMIGKYFNSVGNRVTESREGQNPLGGPIEGVQNLALGGLQMFADLFTGYEQVKNTKPSVAGELTPSSTPTMLATRDRQPHSNNQPS